MARTFDEKAIDRLFALYVIDRCRNEHGLRSISETKMQKLIFYSEKKLIENSCKALNYRFIKLLYPTFSQELRNDLNALVDLGFLNKSIRFRENSKTRMILEDFHHVFDNNLDIMKMIDDETDRYAPIPTATLVDITYRLLWKKKRIVELRKGTPILFPLKEERASCNIEISDEDLEDLAICLSQEISKGIEQAFDELRRGQRLTHAETFG